MTSSLNVLFPDITEVDVNVLTKGQVEYVILRQFGFAFEANQTIPASFYTIDIDCNQSTGAIYNGNADSSGNLIFEALKDVDAKYLVDNTADDTVDVSGWSESGLNGTAVSSKPIGKQILNAVLGPMLSETWGYEAVANTNEIALAEGHSDSYDEAGSELDHKIAKGLADTISSASASAHDEVIGHLLDQVKDASGSIATDLAAARALSLFADNNTDLSANGVEAYAGQVFWMKVYLDVAFGGTPDDAVTDYEQTITGVLDDDDDDTPVNSNGDANLVQKSSATDTVTYNALRPKFLDAFKGSVTAGGVTVDFGEGQNTSGSSSIAQDAAVTQVRIPLLLKLTVA